MLSIALTVGVAVIDGTVANVALPTIAREMGTTPASSIWIVNAYQLAIVMTVLPFSSLGDIIGYRRVYRAGIITLTLGSLFCALSHSLISLTFARFMQGLGSSALISVNLALIRNIFPAKMLGRGVGINAMIVATSAVLGPTIAAGILSVASWPWLFAVNVPVGILAFIITTYALPNPIGSGRPFDYKSALLSAMTFGILLSSVSAFGHGGTAAKGAIGVALAIFVGYVLVRRQLSQPAPLLPVDLLRRPVFGLSLIASISCFAAQALALVSLPFYLQNALGRTQVECGLLISPWPLGVMIAAPIAGYLAERRSTAILAGMGVVAMSAGLLSMVMLPAHAHTMSIVWRMALCGVGFGFFQAPNNRDIISSAPKQRSGAASGMLGTARLSGQTLGAASVALIFDRFSGAGNAASLTVGAGFALAAAVVIGLRMKSPEPGVATVPPESVPAILDASPEWEWAMVLGTALEAEAEADS